MNPPRRLTLIAPDWSQLDTIWKNPLPFALWPVCGKPILSYWLDLALHENPDIVVIHAADRPHLIRAWLDQGNYWSKKFELSTGGDVPADGRLMDTLPGSGISGPVENGAALLERWFALHDAATTLRHAASLPIDREITPGVWAAPGSVIHPTAKLTAPCWIGPKVLVGPGCNVGPRAYLGGQSILEEDVEVTEAVVCDETFVGRHTRLYRSAAQGGLLLDWGRGVAVRIQEDFILADLSRHPARPAFMERLAAFALRLIFRPVALFWNLGQRPRKQTVLVRDASLHLATWPRGPLLVRRESWLAGVASGRLRLLGILPRGKGAWDALPAEIRSALENAPVGVLALSDLFDCHDADEPDEWMHAAYQAGAPGGAGFRQLKRAALQLAFKTPLTP